MKNKVLAYLSVTCTLAFAAHLSLPTASHAQVAIPGQVEAQVSALSARPAQSVSTFLDKFPPDHSIPKGALPDGISDSVRALLPSAISVQSDAASLQETKPHTQLLIYLATFYCKSVFPPSFGSSFLNAAYGKQLQFAQTAALDNSSDVALTALSGYLRSLQKQSQYNSCLSQTYTTYSLYAAQVTPKRTAKAASSATPSPTPNYVNIS
jgi:hypothetical protein